MNPINYCCHLLHGDNRSLLPPFMAGSRYPFCIDHQYYPPLRKIDSYNHNGALEVHRRLPAIIFL
jgi:hypothetical protein